MSIQCPSHLPLNQFLQKWSPCGYCIFTCTLKIRVFMTDATNMYCGAIVAVWGHDFTGEILPNFMIYLFTHLLLQF